MWLRYKFLKSRQLSEEPKKTRDEVGIEEWGAYRAQKISENAKRREDNEVTKRRQQREDEAIEKWKAQHKEQLAKELKRALND